MNCKTLIHDITGVIKSVASASIKKELAAILAELVMELSGEYDDESLAISYSCKFNKFRKKIEMPAELSIAKKKAKPDECICGSTMLSNIITNEMYCLNCGIVVSVMVSAEVHDDIRLVKSGTFNPNVHFENWWLKITASEDRDELSSDGDHLGFKLIEEIKALVFKEKKILKMITLPEIRNYLKRMNRTKFNKNAAFIMKEITGIPPPKFDVSIKNTCSNLFSKVLAASEQIDRGGRVNRNYYPYTIMKILDSVLDPNDRYNRRIFHYIYLQSSSTISGDDKNWELICDIVKDIKYKSTNIKDLLKFGLND